MQALAAQLAHTDGIRSVTGTVNGDESWFDSRRGEPASGYGFDPDLEGVLSGLSFNRGETGSQGGAHAPAAYAALQLRGALRAEHVTVHSGGAATAPPVRPCSPPRAPRRSRVYSGSPSHPPTTSSRRPC